MQHLHVDWSRRCYDRFLRADFRRLGILLSLPIPMINYFMTYHHVLKINKDWHGTGMTLPRGGHGWGNTSAIPTVITWTHGGKQAYIEGSYDNWSTRTPMHKVMTSIRVKRQIVFKWNNPSTCNMANCDEHI